jgi:hypothetical protein
LFFITAIRPGTGIAIDAAPGPRNIRPAKQKAHHDERKYVSHRRISIFETHLNIPGIVDPAKHEAEWG